ncbi:MAG: LLM class F420-dependent oxidoreductase [Gammaproteobacteria bacterium]|nr:LLM class F420-dependent oxidoreductase [Gammaproteobacteria bacterium]
MIRCGVIIFATDKSIQPIELAKAVEERGLDSLFVPEHTHIPTNSVSPFLPGGEIPEPYRRTYDPFVVLAACAAVTERISLGTGICLVSQRHPITLAKEVATLDNISNGRFIFGIGAGWNKPEIENHGTAFEQRWAVLRERILAMKTIWTEDEAEFHGEFVDFDPIWSYPKPVQAGGPPIWIGANSKYVADRVAEFGDGWLPIGGRAGGANIAQVRAACEKRGRSFDDITLALFFPPMDEGEARAQIELGYSELIFHLPSEGADKVLPVLDDIAVLADKLRG